MDPADRTAGRPHAHGNTLDVELRTAFARPAITGLLLALALGGVGAEPISMLAFGVEAIGREFTWWALFPLLSIGLAMVAAFCAFRLRSTGLLGVGILAALAHLARFYYLYGTTLMWKSFIMLVAGAVLLAAGACWRSDGGGEAMKSVLTRALLLVAALAVLVAVNGSILAKERIKTNGMRIFLELAPVDPRSLMQGDYMALRFAIADKLSSDSGGTAALKLDERGVATLDPDPAQGRAAHALSPAQRAGVAGHERVLLRRGHRRALRGRALRRVPARSRQRRGGAGGIARRETGSAVATAHRHLSLTRIHVDVLKSATRSNRGFLMDLHRAALSLMASIAVAWSVDALADEGVKPWMNPALEPDTRAELVVAQMTREEKQTLLFGYFGTDAPWKKFTAAPEALEGSAGYVPGIARLGIPPQWITDAGIGVATQGGAKNKRGRTALPSGMATAATWNPDLARRAGEMIGAEARASGFNVLLAGGVNLVREPRNGRNFEYAGEDPLLAGVIVGAQIRGIESNHIVSTIKHYALNDQETDRNEVNVVIDRAQARMSDLLAFQIAMDLSNPGSVMCSYNKVWGEHACESAYLLNDLLRRDWGWRGYVMSDWGATHSTGKAANSGLDQQSGYPFDDKPYFGELMLKAVASGELGERRLSEMARRIVRTLFAKGVIDHPVRIADIDFAAHAVVTRKGAEEGAVLLKNEKLLPLAATLKRIAVIGGHADVGVLAGGGSSLVYPVGGNAVPGLKPTSWPGPIMYYPSSPLKAIQALAQKATVEFASGEDIKAAAAAGGEERGRGGVRDAMERRVVRFAAHARKPGCVDRGGRRRKPQYRGGARDRWCGAHALARRSQGCLAAWYPGTSGGEAIANICLAG